MKVQAKQLEYLEQAELNRAAREVQEQASGVAVWIRMSPNSLPVVVGMNSSKVPIYDLRIRIVVGGQVVPGVVAKYSVKGPDSGARELEYATRNLIPAAEQALTADGSVLEWGKAYQAGDLGIAVSFTDANGVGWSRSVDGRLVKL